MIIADGKSAEALDVVIIEYDAEGLGGECGKAGVTEVEVEFLLTSVMLKVTWESAQAVVGPVIAAASSTSPTLTV